MAADRERMDAAAGDAALGAPDPESVTAALGFRWKLDRTQVPPQSTEPAKPPFMVKKLMEEYVWDIVALEGSPYTFVHAKTLLDGQVVPGYSESDQQQVLNQRRALRYVLETAAARRTLDKQLTCELHARIAREEALAWGRFRDGAVGISGTKWTPPDASELDALFARGLEAILSIAHPVERALAYHLFGARSQLFFDGNKRTSRAVMNFILLREGYYYLSVPGARRDEYDAMMIDFYDTADATAGMRFMLSLYRSWDG